MIQPPATDVIYDAVVSLKSNHSYKIAPCHVSQNPEDLDLPRPHVYLEVGIGSQDQLSQVS